MVVGYVSVSKADQYLSVEAQRREMERERPVERSRMAGSCGLTADGIDFDPHAKAQDAIVAARKLREEGYSLRAVAVHLGELGHLPRSGRAWHPETVEHLLSAEALDWP